MRECLAQNIRNYRKEMDWNQEQLAESLGVSVGAVSKWERNAAVPDIVYIMQMAELFGITVDALLGFRLHSVAPATAVEQIKKLYRERKFKEGRETVEQHLKKFPNRFAVLHSAAQFYMIYTVEYGDVEIADRAVELLYRCIDRFSDNTSSEISELEIYQDIATCLTFMGQGEHAIELLKQHNPSNINDCDIGMIYANNLQRPMDAFPHLATALQKNLSLLIRNMTGFSAAYILQKRYDKALEVFDWLIGWMENLRAQEGQVTYFDRSIAIFSANGAVLAERMEDTEAAEKYLRRAYERAKVFDAAPEFGMEGLKFNDGHDPKVRHYDNFGESMTMAIEDLMLQNAEDTPRLYRVWKEINQS